MDEPGDTSASEAELSRAARHAIAITTEARRMWNGPDVDSASLVASLAALVRDATEDVGSDNLIGAVAVFLAVVTNDNPSVPQELALEFAADDPAADDAS